MAKIIMSTRVVPGIVVACGLALAVVVLCWVSHVQARGYAAGSRDALEASLFDPFLLTADPLMLPVVRSAAADAPAAAPTPVVGPTTYVYIPPIRVPYRPPLRSPSRPPI